MNYSLEISEMSPKKKKNSSISHKVIDPCPMCPQGFVEISSCVIVRRMAVSNIWYYKNKNIVFASYNVVSKLKHLTKQMDLHKMEHITIWFEESNLLKQSKTTVTNSVDEWIGLSTSISFQSLRSY